MVSHVFYFYSSFINNEGNWDSDCEYLIIDDDKFHFMGAICDYDKMKMEELFPNRIVHNTFLSQHRGKLETNESTIDLKINYLDVWKKLNVWCEFKNVDNY